MYQVKYKAPRRSPPSRAAWIEIYVAVIGTPADESPPSRAAWIEIVLENEMPEDKAESPPSRAAWIEIICIKLICFSSLSPPSRAAWIEIEPADNQSATPKVAAFTGGVD